MKKADLLIKEQEDAKMIQAEHMREQKAIWASNLEEKQKNKYYGMLESIANDQATQAAK